MEILYGMVEQQIAQPENVLVTVELVLGCLVAVATLVTLIVKLRKK